MNISGMERADTGSLYLLKALKCHQFNNNQMSPSFLGLEDPVYAEIPVVDNRDILSGIVLTDQ